MINIMVYFLLKVDLDQSLGFLLGGCSVLLEIAVLSWQTHLGVGPYSEAVNLYLDTRTS